MLRATRLALALTVGDQPDIAPDRPLLVIGAGAAGVCAAMTAAYLGVPCVIVEASDGAFRRQWDVSSRWLDPTEYDFPQPHWEHAEWPPALNAHRGDLALPLVYEPMLAADLAARWDRSLQLWLQEGREADDPQSHPASRFIFIDGCRVKPESLGFSAQGVRWFIPDPRSPFSEFGAVISCVGQGVENTSPTPASPFRGEPFWRTDRLSNRNLGVLRQRGESLGVLVSGGGDGAQQEIQRILCGDFGRRLLERDGGVLEARLSLLVRRGALLKSDRARRDALASGDEEAARQAQQAWDETYEGAATELWLGLGVAQRLQLSDALLRPEVLSAPIHLTWLLRGDRPTFCYGLNRLLTQVVLLAYQIRTSNRALVGGQAITSSPDRQPLILQRHQIVRVDPAAGAHACKPEDDSFGCAGHGHDVQVAPTGLTAERRSLGRYQIIVVRHGLEPAALFGGAAEREPFMPFDGT